MRRAENELSGVRGTGSATVCEIGDKDSTAALLARELEADALLLLTDVPCVERRHGSEQAEPIGECTAGELDPLDFAEGSMRPKVEAACEFAEITGRPAAIGALKDAAEILAGRRGTRVHPGGAPILETERAVRRLATRSVGLQRDAQQLTRLAHRAEKPIFGPRRHRRPPASGHER